VKVKEDHVEKKKNCRQSIHRLAKRVILLAALVEKRTVALVPPRSTNSLSTAAARPLKVHRRRSGQGSLLEKLVTYWPLAKTATVAGGVSA